MVTNVERIDPSSAIDKAKDTIKSKASDAADAIYDKADDMANTAQDLKKQAYKAGAQLREWMGDFRKQADDARYRMEHTIRERPFLSSLAVFAAGIVAAKVLSRK